MRLGIGYELRYQFPQPTPVILMLNVHDSRTCDLDKPDDIVIEPAVPISRREYLADVQALSALAF